MPNHRFNAESLQFAAGAFEVVLTRDKGVAFQQHLQRLSIGVRLIRAPRHRVEALQPLIAEGHNALNTI